MQLEMIGINVLIESAEGVLLFSGVLLEGSVHAALQTLPARDVYELKEQHGTEQGIGTGPRRTA